MESAQPPKDGGILLTGAQKAFSFQRVFSKKNVRVVFRFTQLFASPAQPSHGQQPSFPMCHAKQNEIKM